jgi:hypothetical protein
MKAHSDHSRSEMLRRLRLGNLRKLFRDRYGPVLPNDDAGREDLYELLLPISVGPHADIKMQNAIEVWAPWLPPADVKELVDCINLTPIWNRKPTARQLGKRLRLTNGERERLRLWTIAPYHMNAQELLAQRKAKRRARTRLLRQLRGSKPRAIYEAESKSKIKPWEPAGIKRRAWYYRQAKQKADVASPADDWRRNSKSPDERLDPDDDLDNSSECRSFLPLHKCVPK